MPQATLNPEILVPRVLWRFENRQKSENTENTENTLHSFILTLNNISTFFLTYNVWHISRVLRWWRFSFIWWQYAQFGRFTIQRQDEYDDRAGEGPIDADGYNGDGICVSSPSDIGEGYEVSSVASLDLVLRAIKGSPAEFFFVQLNTTPDCDMDIVDRRVKTSGETTTLKIWIPMFVDKHRAHTPARVEEFWSLPRLCHPRHLHHIRQGTWAWRRHHLWQRRLRSSVGLRTQAMTVVEGRRYSIKEKEIEEQHTDICKSEQERCGRWLWSFYLCTVIWDLYR